MYKTTALTCGVLLLAGSLAGCLRIQRQVERTAPLAETSGYVAGVFGIDNGGIGFGLGILNPQTNREYVIPFGQPTVTPTRDGGLSMIAVPPGQYRISSWVSYSTSRDKLAGDPVPDDSPLARPFTVKAGGLVILGRMLAAAQPLGESTRYSIKPAVLSTEKAFQAFRDGYPAFAKAPMECLFCM